MKSSNDTCWDESANSVSLPPTKSWYIGIWSMQEYKWHSLVLPNCQTETLPHWPHPQTCSSPIPLLYTPLPPKEHRGICGKPRTSWWETIQCNFQALNTTIETVKHHPKQWHPNDWQPGQTGGRLAYLEELVNEIIESTTCLALTISKEWYYQSYWKYWSLNHILKYCCITFMDSLANRLCR